MFRNKDGYTARGVSVLLDHVSTWPFVLTVYTWCDALFCVNKTSKFIQASDVSNDVLQVEIGVTMVFEDNWI